jgi:hypothetical protein
MAGCRNLLDALAERSTATDDVGNLGLVTIDLDRSRAHIVGGCLQIYELRFHDVLSKGNGGHLGRHGLKNSGCTNA